MARNAARDSEKYNKLKAREDALVKRMISDAKKLEKVRGRVARLLKRAKDDEDAERAGATPELVGAAEREASRRAREGAPGRCDESYPTVLDGKPTLLRCVRVAGHEGGHHDARFTWPAGDLVAAPPPVVEIRMPTIEVGKARPTAIKNGTIDFPCDTCGSSAGMRCVFTDRDGVGEPVEGRFHAARKRAAGRHK